MLAILLLLLLAQSAPPQITAIANGFSYQNAQSPGCFIVIAGTNLATQTATFSGPNLPTTLGGAMVLFEGTPMPLYYASPTQIDAQLPYETAVSLASLEVITVNGESDPFEFDIFAASPGIAAITNADGSVNTATNPVHAGSAVTIYFTGIGPVSNQPKDGQPAPSKPLAIAELPVSVTIGTTSLEPAFAGLSPGSIGLAQVNVTIPQLAAGNYPLTITIGSAVSNTLMIAVASQ